jgi:hypothetical protein
MHTYIHTYIHTYTTCATDSRGGFEPVHRYNSPSPTAVRLLGLHPGPGDSRGRPRHHGVKWRRPFPSLGWTDSYTKRAARKVDICCMYVCIYVCIYLYVCMEDGGRVVEVLYLCQLMNVCTYVCMYVCMYILYIYCK